MNLNTLNEFRHAVSGLSWLLSTSVRKKSFFFGFSCRFLTSDI